MACGILVPRPGIEPRPSAVKAPSPNHWTAGEFPVSFHFLKMWLLEKFLITHVVNVMFLLSSGSLGSSVCVYWSVPFS